MMSVVNGSSASNSHVGSLSTTTTTISSGSVSSGGTASSEQKQTRSRRSKKSSSAANGGAAAATTTLSADAPTFTPTRSSDFLSTTLKKKAARKVPRSAGGGASTAATARAPSQPPKDSEVSVFSTANEGVEADSDEVEPCLLCADPIRFYAVGECNHTGICSKCFMRMRMILNDKACPMCKTVLDRVIVSKEQRTFESFQLWGDALGYDSFLDDPSEMIFHECRAHYEAMRALREFKCRVKKCKESKHTLSQLKDHLRRDHGAEFCELCLKHQHFFVQEQQVFTKASIKAHNVGRNRSTGPKQSGKDFHPMCQFCKKRFYGDGELFEHLERDHFKCHICKAEHEYFRN